MKDFFKNNAWVLLLFTSSVLISCYFLFTIHKHTLHLNINQYVGNYTLDRFFYYITYLGDGLIAVFLLMIVLFYNVRLGIYTTFSFLGASLFSIGLKHLFFDDENRPFFIFNYINPQPLNLVDGVHEYIHNSFPSGHATQAFSIFMCLIFFTKNQTLKFTLFAIAVLTAFSRVYLSQHWLIDITVGSFIGFCFSVVYYFIFVHQNKFQNLNKSIFALRRGEI